MLILLGCNLDNALSNKPGENDTAGHVDTSAPDTDTDTTIPEVCNGVDDDGDGAIDEDFPDDDANGRADCVDETCPPFDLATAGTVPVEACRLPAIEDPWNVVVEWTFPMGDGSYCPPVVGRLVDTTGDGVVDGSDLPVIVAISLWGTLVALYGDGSGVAFTLTGLHGFSAPALADVTGDGVSELLAIVGDGTVQAIDGTGAVIWTSEVVFPDQVFPTLSVADVDGDGTIEVVLQTAILAGADGSVLATFPFQDTVVTTTVSDLDQDGRSEVILGRTVWGVDGTEVWSEGPRDLSEFNAVADADGDGLGDVITVSSSRMTIHTADGTRIVDVALPGTRWPGPPGVADFDGDGVAEICVPDETKLGIYELDGSLVWEAPMSDVSGWAGCTGFDANGDGAVDVFVADETAVTLYDGPTGTVEFMDINHNSGTGFEYPVIADVDGDGSAEVVVVSIYGGAQGVTVYGQADNAWPSAGENWPVHDYAITNVEEDGTVPSPAPAHWDLFRARAGAFLESPTANLRVTIDDVCVADCVYGPVALAFHVQNVGEADVPAGTPAAIYALDGAARLVATVVLPAIAAGETSAGIEVDMTVADLGPDGFQVVVDDDGSGGLVRECDETDNTATWAETGC